MRIVFVCGSLEPGKDGVGDYTFRLCDELKALGHQTAILALNDRYVSEVKTETFDEGNGTFEVLRIPHLWASSRRYQVAKNWVEKNRPERISLQYVPYAFQKQGTPISLARQLKKNFKSAGWHVMVHEPFLAYPQKGAKNKIIQALQITALQLLKKKLRPVFHTTIQHYKKMLADVAIDAKILGLFGNIKIEGIAEKYGRYGKDDSNLLGVYFGAVPPASQHLDFAEGIRKYGETTRQRIKIVFCGRGGALAEQFADTVRQICQPDLCEVAILGKLDAREITHLFSVADFGISRVPARLIGKSGAAICMLEHGLPLWVPLVEGSNDKTYIDFRPELCFQSLADIQDVERGKAFERLPVIAAQLVADLESY